jgi:hypothetical protein
MGVDAPASGPATDMPPAAEQPAEEAAPASDETTPQETPNQ